MDPEKLTAFIKSRGYTNVKVDVYENSFKVHCSSPKISFIEHHYKFPISELPNKPDGSEKYLLITNAFPSVFETNQEV
jgi:hypothetical protein